MFLAYQLTPKHLSYRLMVTCEKAFSALCNTYCLMKDVGVLDGEWGLYYLEDVLASQYQSSHWIQPTSNQSSICWGNVLAPGAMHSAIGEVA